MVGKGIVGAGFGMDLKSQGGNKGMGRLQGFVEKVMYGNTWKGKKWGKWRCYLDGNLKTSISLESVWL